MPNTKLNLWTKPDCKALQDGRQNWIKKVQHWYLMTVLSSNLSTCRVDAYGAVQLLLGDSTFHGCTEALRHLSCVWPQVVKPNDSILQCGSNNSNITTDVTNTWVAMISEKIHLRKILHCPVYCRWSFRSICCCPCRAQWTPEARTDCGISDHREHKCIDHC